MNFIRVVICYNNIIYDKIFIFQHTMVFYKYNKKHELSCSVLENNINLVSCSISQKPKSYILIHCDGILTHYLVKELTLSKVYRIKFIDKVKHASENLTNALMIQLKEPKRQVLDYAWNYRIEYLVREKVELDHVLSWLSTLGGAFSALGDYFTNYALIAGRISFHQLKLALRLGDPNIAARCRLYLSLSLMQQGYLRQAKHIVRREYADAKNALVKDNRLIRMCLGIWSKLQYEYKRRRCR